MGRLLKDGSENGKATFSVRLPKGLADQIDARAHLSRRTRNAEIVVMLEAYTDLCVARDKAILLSQSNSREQGS